MMRVFKGDEMKDRSADPLGPTPDIGKPKPEGDGFAQPATLTAALALIAAMYLAREILVPIVLALIFSFLVAPLVRILQRIRVNQVVAVLVSVVVPLCIVVLFAGIVGSQIAQLAQSLPQYRETIDSKLQSMQDLANGKLGQFLGRAGQVIARVSSGQGPPAAAAPASVTQSAPSTPPPVQQAAAPPESRGPPLVLVGHFLSALLEPLATAFIVFIVSIFMLLERNTVRDRFIKLTGARDSARTTVALDEAAARLSSYFVSQLGVNTAVGVVIGAGLAMMGGPSPILWGVLAALLRFIPYIGVWIAALLAGLLAAAVDPGWSMMFWTLGLFAVVELIAGQIAEPLLYGHTTGLSPLSVVVAAIFWSWLWGPVGLLLSTPLTLCLVVLGRYVERLNFLEILLGDKPQVTPAQQLYEHLREDDVEAALKQAEETLAKGNPTEYYDQILIPALRLVGDASATRALTNSHVNSIRASAQELVKELAAHLGLAKTAAEPSVTRQVILVAARGPIDEVLIEALRHLFETHHLEVLASAAAGSAQVPELDATRCHICVLSAAPARSASGVHLTARKVRQIYPGLPILSGIYSKDELQSVTHEGDDLDQRCSSAGELLEELLHPKSSSAASGTKSVAAVGADSGELPDT
jgi:predicted PurR-regulated permease PerM